MCRWRSVCGFFLALGYVILLSGRVAKFSPYTRLTERSLIQTYSDEHRFADADPDDDDDDDGDDIANMC